MLYCNAGGRPGVTSISDGDYIAMSGGTTTQKEEYYNTDLLDSVYESNNLL